MSIKNKVYLIIVLSILLIIALVYLFSRPKNVPIIDKCENSNHLEYQDVNEFVYQKSDNIHLFFYDTNNDNSKLVLEYLDQIKKTHKIDTYENLYFVDVTGITDSSYTKLNWGFYNSPAFLCMRITNNQVDISNKLEWQMDMPYTKEEIESWLVENKLIN